MSLLERIHAARSFDPARFVAFEVDGARVGHVRRDLLERLRAFPNDLSVDETGVRFRPGLDGVEARSRAMARIAAALAAERLLTPWRNETYDIGVTEHGTCLFRLERAAVRYFGLLARAVHINGIVDRAGTKSMWVARRSAEKAIDPGMLDNMVGGGLASGLSMAQTVVKEAWEEAGIPAELAATACPSGSMRIVREVPEGLHREIIYAYDLVLPTDFVPVNQDGEVAELKLSAFGDVRRSLEGDAPFTVDAGLVAIDCLLRHQALEAHWANAIHARLDQ